MSLTPLFPTNEPLSIKQGTTGDCYLLAAIDTMMAKDKKSEQHLKNIFKENSDGSVEVRLAHNPKYSPNLRNNPRLQQRYGYYHDTKTNEDVFTVPKNLLEEIDNDLKGATTNSLAVKTLEHITPYYFDHNWSANVNTGARGSASVKAHSGNRWNRAVNHGAFVANAMGFDANDLGSGAYGTYQARQYMDSAKNPALYVECDWGEKDHHGQRHGRHAVRVRKIEKDNTTGELMFHLANPWDTSAAKDVKLPYHQMIQRRPTFSTFNPSPSVVEQRNKRVSEEQQKASSNSITNTQLEIKPEETQPVLSEEQRKNIELLNTLEKDLKAIEENTQNSSDTATRREQTFNNFIMNHHQLYLDANIDKAQDTSADIQQKTYTLQEKWYSSQQESAAQKGVYKVAKEIIDAYNQSITKDNGRIKTTEQEGKLTFKNANDAIEFMQEQATGKSPKAFAMADPNKDFAVYSDGKGNFKAGSKQEVKAFAEKHPIKKDSTTTNTAETSSNLSPLAPLTSSVSHRMVA